MVESVAYRKIDYGGPLHHSIPSQSIVFIVCNHGYMNMPPPLIIDHFTPQSGIILCYIFIATSHLVFSKLIQFIYLYRVNWISISSWNSWDGFRYWAYYISGDCFTELSGWKLLLWSMLAFILVSSTNVVNWHALQYVVYWMYNDRVSITWISKLSVSMKGTENFYWKVHSLYIIEANDVSHTGNHLIRSSKNCKFDTDSKRCKTRSEKVGERAELFSSPF